METPQPDKTGMRILLKLASLVVILAGIHAAADIIVQLLLALFFAIVLNPLVTWFIRRGVQRPVAITIVVVVMLIALTALVGVLAASFNEFISMLPKFNKELTRKLFKLQEMLPFLNLHMSPGANTTADGLGKSGYLHHGANDRAFRGNGERAFAGDDRSFYAV